MERPVDGGAGGSRKDGAMSFRTSQSAKYCFPGTPTARKIVTTISNMLVHFENSSKTKTNNLVVVKVVRVTDSSTVTRVGMK